ncbi:HAMP domain-containing sensor histidine kinase [Clostridium sp. KNHs214]|uniref:sensor histidine kinase n=1 Tax=Clostridium sp. KNHs214 TaxID=1540257 RepID=UPI00163B32D8|nr:HAMP domain-containing sensor histidine kinase [Clostridium sp. KNHs214]
MKMNSIKKRLSLNFLTVIFITVAIFETLIISGTKQYYYKNIEDSLTNQVKMSSEFYTKYFSNSSLKENVQENVDVFWKQTSAQVQIIDEKGNILMDSIGVIPSEIIKDDSFKNAMDGKLGKWHGNVSYSKHKVFSVTYPLKSNNKIVGALRFITSLAPVDREIFAISMILSAIGFITLFTALVVSIFMSNTIVGPIKNLTAVAQKMAAGDLNVRNTKTLDDEVGKLSDTLNYMADEILKKEQLKNEFISSVSHELRTPLTSIKGWAITLKTDELNDKDLIRDGLQIIEQESERLTGMVEELLDFSKFVSGKITLNKEMVDINILLEYIRKQLSPRANRDNINFVVKKTENIPTVAMDPNRIKQVLLNLVDNAFNFTPEGGTVTVWTEIQNKYLILHVDDTGCGISEDDLPKIKEKFYKGKSSKSKNGIGLSICDEIIKLHNGFFIITSELNIGTNISVKIPIEI